MSGNNLARDPCYGGDVFQIDTAPPFRVQRIRELLRTTEKSTVGDHIGYHTDLKLLRAQRVMPAVLEDLRGMSDLDDVELEALHILEQRNYEASAEAPAPAIPRAAAGTRSGRPI